MPQILLFLVPCGPVSWIHLIEFVSGLLFTGSEKINWVEPLLSALAQACHPGVLSSPVVEGSCHSFGKPGFWMGSRQSAPGPFINSRCLSRACTNQALNRAAFLVGCVGFRIRDVIENIFGQRLRVYEFVIFKLSCGVPSFHLSCH